MKNKIKDLLLKLNISTDKSIIDFYPAVRDRDDVSVLKCNNSGVIFLSRTDHMEITHYETKESYSEWGVENRKEALKVCEEDDKRRFNQFKDIIQNKSWLDIGTGAGGILDYLSPVAETAVAVEPHNCTRNALVKLGYKVKSSLNEVENNSCDVITLFHVLEHITTPIATLKEIRTKMKVGSKLIIEIPHARDFLLSQCDLNEFKAFTLWSEHLILHTRESLKTFLGEAGFTNIKISGFQRYSLSNHLYWLAKKKPEGHRIWDDFNDKSFNETYSNMLSNMDCNDTLIAVITK